MSKPYDEVVAFLRRVLPSAGLEVSESSSGAAMIDVRAGTRFIVIEYLPRMGFGVSEPSHSDSGFSGHDQAFATPREAITYLEQLLGIEREVKGR